MSFRQLSLSVLVSCAMFAGCGGVETGMSLMISRTTSALAADAVRARVQVHVPDRTCDDVKNSGPEKRATHALDFTLNGGTMGEGTISEIRPGKYTVVVWTFGNDGMAREFGCREGVEIEEGVLAEVSIVVEGI